MKDASKNFSDFLQSKRIEPEPRMVGGKMGYAFHRFPIKGGVSFYDIFVSTAQKSNALYAEVTKRK